jgi:hypothetical protein
MQNRRGYAGYIAGAIGAVIVYLILDLPDSTGRRAAALGIGLGILAIWWVVEGVIGGSIRSAGKALVIPAAVLLVGVLLTVSAFMSGRSTLQEATPTRISAGQGTALPPSGETQTSQQTQAAIVEEPTAQRETPGVRILQVLNPGDITSEAVEIVNDGSSVGLQGWTLTNGRGDTFTFPGFQMFSGGSLKIFTGVGPATPLAYFRELDEAVWRIGDVAALYDATGKLQDEYTVGQ